MRKETLLQIILIPFERKCVTANTAKNSFNANFKFKSLDGTIVRRTNLEIGTEVTLILGNGAGKVTFPVAAQTY